MKDLGGVYEITATVTDTAMLEWWLRGFGDAISNVRRRKVDGQGKLGG